MLEIDVLTSPRRYKEGSYSHAGRAWRKTSSLTLSSSFAPASNAGKRRKTASSPVSLTLTAICCDFNVSLPVGCNPEPDHFTVRRRAVNTFCWDSDVEHTTLVDETKFIVHDTEKSFARGICSLIDWGPRILISTEAFGLADRS